MWNFYVLWKDFTTRIPLIDDIICWHGMRRGLLCRIIYCLIITYRWCFYGFILHSCSKKLSSLQFPRPENASGSNLFARCSSKGCSKGSTSLLVAQNLEHMGTIFHCFFHFPSLSLQKTWYMVHVESYKVFFLEIIVCVFLVTRYHSTKISAINGCDPKDETK